SCALIHYPKILLLDEPTTGVDPVSRRDFWKILSSLLKEGITIFMTTPYLDEAERCNRVALMHRGEIIGLDTPERIKNSVGKKSIEIITNDIKSSYKVLKSIAEYEIQIFGDRLNIIANSPEKVIKKVNQILNMEGINLLSYRIVNLSLENVFIHLINK
ncbi:MAG: ABC transporter ATP-binding protein, partial [Ignavibacterium sp.]